MHGYPEPPAVGSEVETLLGSLERQRATFAFKCADLTTEQMRRRVAASSVTIGGLLKHLAFMEDLNFTHDLGQRSLPEPWSIMPAGDRSARVWRSAEDDQAGDLYRLWQDAVARSRAVVAAALDRGGLASTFEARPGVAVSLRRLLVDLIEEYGRHNGHADLIRESVDGRIGEDPPGRPYAFRLD